MVWEEEGGREGERVSGDAGRETWTALVRGLIAGGGFWGGSGSGDSGGYGC